MAQAEDRFGIIYQNLMDAGCDGQMTSRCMSVLKDGRDPELLSMLVSYREALLNGIRISQKQLDCLDFLIHSIKKQLNIQH
ncbi:hypothetical protein [Anaerolentibacter hominis]|uniref:hypothetical protein n=1 Tax=Anaerolentibacter hominis TaxID=3079009 RepID=UPI0031B80BC6